MKISKIEQVKNNYFSKIYFTFVYNEESHKANADFSFTAPIEGFLHNFKITNSNDEEIPVESFPSWFIEKISNEAFEYIQKENDFINYHRTGDIPSSAYGDHKIDYRIEQYPKLILTFEDKQGEAIEFRKTGEKLKYVKKVDGEILRDENGNAIYLSEDEMKAKNLHLEDTCIVAFNSKQESVALASDEFGADGIWVNQDYQNRGIGLKILELFRNQFSEYRKMGQMTDAGRQLARAFFRKQNI